MTCWRHVCTFTFAETNVQLLQRTTADNVQLAASSSCCGAFSFLTRRGRLFGDWRIERQQVLKTLTQGVARFWTGASVVRKWFGSGSGRFGCGSGVVRVWFGSGSEVVRGGSGVVRVWFGSGSGRFGCGLSRFLTKMAYVLCFISQV